MLNRVVVTGMGAVTSLGKTAKETWQALVRGDSGIDYISLFDAQGYKTKIAAEVKNFDSTVLKEKYPYLEKASRATFLTMNAAEEAFEEAKLSELISTPDFEMSLYLGVGDSGEDTSKWAQALIDSKTEDSFSKRKFYDEAIRNVQSDREIEKDPTKTLVHLAQAFSIRGSVTNCLTACAASSQAIGEAYELIRHGESKVVMTGGAHAMIHPMGVAGFSCLKALSTRNDDPKRASRPFDKDRDGFVIGEGAAILILESEEHAIARGAEILGEIVGYGSTADAYRPTDMCADGDGASRAMLMAMRKAAIQLEEIDYINAHGTSTSVNDRSETFAIKKTFGDLAYKIPVSSIKSMIGHPIAAAGAIEIITCLNAIKASIIPPTLNYETLDAECDLDYVPNKSREKRLQTVLSNSFGFGGQNVCLIVKEYNK